MRCDVANVKKIEAYCSSTSNRTFSSIKTGSNISSLAAPAAGTYTTSGSITKNTCDQVIAVEFTSVLAAGTYVNFIPSGNVNVHQIVLTTAPAGPVDPTITFGNGSYEIGGAALDLSSLLTANNSDGTVSYSIKDANGTGAQLAADGKSFSATTAGTATVTVSVTGTSNYNAASADATITVNAPAPKTVYLKPGTTNWGSTAYIYDVTNETMSEEPMTVGSGCLAGYFYGEVPANCETVIFSKTSNWSGDLPKQSVDFSLAEHNLLELQGVGTYGEAENKYYGNWLTYSTPVYTITLVDNGADGGAEMTNPTVDCGGDVTLPKMTRTKTGYVFVGWQNLAAEPVHDFEDEATISNIGSSFTLTAQWAPVVEKVIYSWEGHADAAIEVGGTASGVGGAGVNYAQAGYYTLQLGDKADYSGKYVQIALDNNIVAGDKVTMTMFYNKSKDGVPQTASTAPKMVAGDGTIILNDATDLTANIAVAETDPETRNYIVPAGISTNVVKLTRGKTSTTTFVTKLVITRTVGLVSEALKSANAAKVAGEAVAYTVSENVITVTPSYRELSAITLVKTQSYSDETTGDAEVEVSLTEGADFFEGTATIGETTYTVKVPVDKATYYTVTYYDYNGTSKLHEESVEAGHVAEGYTYDQPHYTFDKWVDLEGNDVNLSAAITADLDVKASVNKVYSQSFDIERWIMDNGSTADDFATFKTVLAEKGIVDGGILELDNLNSAKDNNNYPYIGCKLKNTANAYISVMVPANKYVAVTTGAVNGLKFQFNGADTNGEANKTVYFGGDANDHTLKIIDTNGTTDIIKAIEIVDNNATKETLDITSALYATYYNSKRAVEVPAGVTVMNAYVDNGEYNFEPLEIVRKDAENLNTNIIPAGVAVVLKADAAGEKTLTYTVGGKTPEHTNLYGSDEAGTTATPAGMGDCYFYGLALNAQKEEGSVGFYWMAENGDAFQNGAHKAYLVLEQSMFESGAPVRFLFNQTDTATGMEEIENNSQDMQKFMQDGKLYIRIADRIYDATGRLVK